MANRRGKKKKRKPDDQYKKVQYLNKRSSERQRERDDQNNTRKLPRPEVQVSKLKGFTEHTAQVENRPILSYLIRKSLQNTILEIKRRSYTLWGKGEGPIQDLE